MSYPAIDLKDGQCVRLQKGDYGTAHKVAETRSARPHSGSSMPVQTLYTWLTLTPLRTARTRTTAWWSRSSARPARPWSWRRHPCRMWRPCLHWAFRALSSARRHCPRPGIRNQAVKIRRQDRCRHRYQSETVRTDGWLGDSGENYIAKFAERVSPSVYATSSPILTRTYARRPNFD